MGLRLECPVVELRFPSGLSEGLDVRWDNHCAIDSSVVRGLAKRAEGFGLALIVRANVITLDKGTQWPSTPAWNAVLGVALPDGPVGLVDANDLRSLPRMTALLGEGLEESAKRAGVGLLAVGFAPICAFLEMSDLNLCVRGLGTVGECGDGGL